MVLCLPRLLSVRAMSMCRKQFPGRVFLGMIPAKNYTAFRNFIQDGEGFRYCDFLCPFFASASQRPASGNSLGTFGTISPWMRPKKTSLPHSMFRFPFGNLWRRELPRALSVCSSFVDDGIPWGPKPDYKVGETDFWLCNRGLFLTPGPCSWHLYFLSKQSTRIARTCPGWDRRGYPHQTQTKKFWKTDS